jgi:hypothetical protein
MRKCIGLKENRREKSRKELVRKIGGSCWAVKGRI